MSLIGSTSLYPINNSSTGNMTVSTRISTTGGSDLIPMTSNPYRYTYSSNMGLDNSYYSDLSMYNALADTGQQAQGMGEEGDILSSSNAVYEPMVQGYTATQPAASPMSWGFADWINMGIIGSGTAFGTYSMQNTVIPQMQTASLKQIENLAKMFGIDTKDFETDQATRIQCMDNVTEANEKWGHKQEKKKAKEDLTKANNTVKKTASELEQRITKSVKGKTTPQAQAPVTTSTPATTRPESAQSPAQSQPKSTPQDIRDIKTKQSNKQAIDTSKITESVVDNSRYKAGNIKIENVGSFDINEAQANQLNQAKDNKAKAKLLKEFATAHNNKLEFDINDVKVDAATKLQIEDIDAKIKKLEQNQNINQKDIQKLKNKKLDILKEAAGKAAGKVSKGKQFLQNCKSTVVMNALSNLLTVGVTGWSEYQQTGELGKATIKSAITGVVNTVVTTGVSAACSLIAGPLGVVVGGVVGGAATTLVNKASNWICSKIPGWSDEEIAQENAEKAAKKNGTYVDPAQAAAQASGVPVITSSQLNEQLNQMTSAEQSEFMAQIQEAIQAGQIVLQ